MGAVLNEDELEEMPARISEHFDRVREALEDSLGADSE
jgi:hypothetical protein